MPGSRLAEPPGQGTPCRVPSSPLSATLLYVSPSLEDQTTFKFDKTRTITTITKRASQRRKNHIDTMSALQEKPRKPKETGRNDEPTRRDCAPEPPPGGSAMGGR